MGWVRLVQHSPGGDQQRPQTQDSNRLEATLPLGDAESLDRLRERCDDVQVRPAGASCLVDAALPADASLGADAAVPPRLEA